jgi:branched-chain amino acid transport system ATP-binding protein
MLRIENIWASYKTEVPVLKGISLALGAHEVVAVLGANGAGKSTLLRVTSGLLPCQKGRIFLDGEEITDSPPHRRVEMGLVHVPEGRQMLAGMTVEENINLGGYCRRHDRVEFSRSLDEVYDLFPILKERRRQLAGSLSGGQQQMVAIGRALMAKPRVLLCDEPSFGLAPLIVREIFAVLGALRTRGIPILLVEQNANKALELSDRGLVLRNGELILTASAAELKQTDTIRLAYLGGATTKEAADRGR